MNFRRFTASAQTFDLPQRYTPYLLLGYGRYGAVCSAFDNAAQRMVAIKKIKSPTDPEFSAFEDAARLVVAQRIFSEFVLLMNMHNDLVVELFDAFSFQPPGQSHPDIYVVMTHMSTDVGQIIRSSQELTPAHIQYIIYQVLCALDYLNSRDIIHRDLKPANVLINSDTSVRLADFGMSCGRMSELLALEGRLAKYVVTRQYRPPEVILECDQYDSKVDMWSTGCIMAELFLRTPLFRGEDFADQLCKIVRILGTPAPEDIPDGASGPARSFLGKIPTAAPVDLATVIPGAPPAALDLIKRMLAFHPDHRISVRDALDHQFFKDIYEEDDLTRGQNPVAICPPNTVDACMKHTMEAISDFVRRHPPPAVARLGVAQPPVENDVRMMHRTGPSPQPTPEQFS